MNFNGFYKDDENINTDINVYDELAKDLPPFKVKTPYLFGRNRLKNRTLSVFC